MSSAILFLYLFVRMVLAEEVSQPYILFVVVDDLGWNDVGWNDPQMPTPNLNKLAHEGIVLNQSYALPICTPSRTAFMTGYYPYRLGLQMNVIELLQPNGLSLNYTLMPRMLKDHGYDTHMVGKWHLGYCDKKFIPTERGFDTFYGFYMGGQDHTHHNTSGIYPNGTAFTGYDFRSGSKKYPRAIGQYSTKLYTKRARSLIRKHDTTKPFFMYLAFHNVHCPLQVPHKYSNMCSHIKDESRRTFCGMVASVDEAMAHVVKELKKAGMYDKTLIVFTSDNGGQVLRGGNNYPLRGNKETLWEGGIRVPGFVHAKFLNLTRGYVSDKLIHAVDWYATFERIANPSLNLLNPDPNGHKRDSIDQWDSLACQYCRPARERFIINILLEGNYFAGVRDGDYKLVIGNPGDMDGWYYPDNDTFDDDVMRGSSVKHGSIGQDSCPENAWGSSHWLNSILPISPNFINANLIATTPPVWFFNIRDDPLERNNLRIRDANFYRLLNQLINAVKSYVPLRNMTYDERGDPRHWDHFYSPGWCDSSRLM